MCITGNQNYPTEMLVLFGKNNKKGLLSLCFLVEKFFVIRFHQESMFNH